MEQIGQGSHRKHRDRDPERQAEWAAKESACRRELEEARARATQMEKTMRWWSECTANWREKWAKVRNERNKAREEAKQHKCRAESLFKELNALKVEKTEMERHLKELKMENEKLLQIGESRIVTELNEEIELRRKGFVSHDHRQRVSLDSHKLSVDESTASELRLKYEETCRILASEKDHKTFLLAKIEGLTAELHNMRIETANDKTISSTDSSQSALERLQNELQDEIAAKQVLEEKQAEMEMELERLRSENALQWGKREMLENENIAILRDNRRLCGQVCELREQIHKLNRLSEGSYTTYESVKIDTYPASSEIYRRDSNNLCSQFSSKRLDSDVLYVSKSGSPRSRDGSSNGSSDGNLHSYDGAALGYDVGLQGYDGSARKYDANVHGSDGKATSEDDDLAIVEGNDKGSVGSS